MAWISKVVIKKYYRKDWNIHSSTWWTYMTWKDDIYIFSGGNCNVKTFEWYCGAISGYRIDIKFFAYDWKPFDDAIYKVYIQTYDNAGNVLESSDISNVYFIKEGNDSCLIQILEWVQYEPSPSLTFKWKKLE